MSQRPDSALVLLLACLAAGSTEEAWSRREPVAKRPWFAPAAKAPRPLQKPVAGRDHTALGRARVKLQRGQDGLQQVANFVHTHRGRTAKLWIKQQPDGFHLWARGKNMRPRHLASHTSLDGLKAQISNQRIKGVRRG